MLATGHRDGAGGLSARTVRHAHSILFAALRQAVRWQLLHRNPAEAVTPPSVTDREIAVFDDAQIGVLLNAARPTRLYVPIMVAVTTGLRRGEVLGLRWSDLDLAAGCLTVAQAIEQTRSKGLTFKAPKTKHGRRTLSLPAVTIEALRSHKAVQAAERLALGLGKDEHGVVFTTVEGEPMNPRDTSQFFGRIVKRAGLPAVTFHGLRHSHLTALLRAGVHPKIASSRAGHASIAITMDTYSHVIPSMQDDLARGVDATIRKAMAQ
jgi:integrase